MSKLDPRIDGLLRRETPGIRLLVVGLFALLSPTQREQVIDELNPRDPDNQSPVGGMPLLHWYGKDRGAVRTEIGDDPDRFAEIEQGLVERGIWPEKDEEATPKMQKVKVPPAKGHPNGAQISGGAEIPEDAKDAKPVPTTKRDEEPTFGGHKLSDLVGKTDEQLLALPNIGKAAIKRIREAEAAAAK